MLLYLDAMIVQYIADNVDYIMCLGGYLSEDEVDLSSLPTDDPKLLHELESLGRLAFLDQLGDGWSYAATPHLMQELLAGQPTTKQKELYDIVKTAWYESEWLETSPLDSAKVATVERSLIRLGLKEADRLHIAQAVVLEAAWFLTNDSEIIEKCRRATLPLRVCRPSECLEGISVGLFLRTDTK
jgi:hypothetical protein